MSFFTPTSSDNIHYRRPLDSQKNSGGDMSIMCFVRPQCPKKFDSPDKHQIKGLNVEALAEILFPPPAWITDSMYSILQANSENDDPNWGSFSLNMSMYNQILIETEWDNKWFFMYGRVHPYVLTWEIKPDDNLETNDDLEPYTIPALIVRDQSYQP
jgi:hypothetical protein